MVKEDFSKFRRIEGGLKILTECLFLIIPILGTLFIIDIPFYLNLPILREQYYGLMITLIFPLVFILIPFNKKVSINKVPWYDLIFIVLSIIIGLYVAIFYGQISLKLGDVTIDRVIVGSIAILLTLEACRRTVNLFIAIFGLFFLLFPHLSFFFPDTFSGISLPLTQQINYLFLDTNASLSILFGLVVTYILGFTLFGNLMVNGGGGTFITDISMAAFGGYRGGPGKISIVASSLFGTISGVAISNVVTTGVITIPLMKKIGYKPHVAGAIESVASTGGIIMPPVMGVTAFVMAEITGIPYYKIAISSIIPALLYYASVFFQVDMEAGKTGLRGLPNEQLPKIKNVLGKIYLFIIPFSILIITLFILYWAPDKSALASVIPILLIGLLINKETRFRLGWILDGLQKTSQAVLLIGPLGVLAGIIVGTISYTGLGFLLSLNIIKLAGGNLLFLLFITAFVCLILGMGMPPIPAYVILAVLVAPALDKLGVDLMAAHLFIIYFSSIAMITPPVCGAAYAGAAIAGANPIKTGWTATRLGIVAYIVPFLFVFFPALLLKGSIFEIIFTFITALFGCFLIATALSGYLFKEINLIKRVIFLAFGLGLLIPIQGHLLLFGVIINIGCGISGLLLIIQESRIKKKIDNIFEKNKRSKKC